MSGSRDEGDGGLHLTNKDPLRRQRMTPRPEGRNWESFEKPYDAGLGSTEPAGGPALLTPEPRRAPTQRMDQSSAHFPTTHRPSTPGVWTHDRRNEAPSEMPRGAALYLIRTTQASDLGSTYGKTRFSDPEIHDKTTAEENARYHTTW